MKQDLRKISKSQLENWLANQGQPKYRASQILEWVWQKSVTKIDEFTNLPKALREKLEEDFEIKNILAQSSQFSNDGTIKTIFRLHDGNLVEGVLIPTDTRMTACISSQVGCALACEFCATGFMGRIRNLDVGEIYDQVAIIKKQSEEHFNAPLTNIVFMGMGEPLLNYKNVLQSIEIITSPGGLNWSPKRITVSTAGIAKMIRKLGDDGVKFNLALSLHVANDEKRSSIMPINDSNSLSELRNALNYFYDKTKNRITVEFIVFHGFNDTIEDARELVEFVKRVPCRVNLIEYNPITEADFKNADPVAFDKFAGYLERNRVQVTVRRSRGKDIDAACGQLAIKEK